MLNMRTLLRGAMAAGALMIALSVSSPLAEAQKTRAIGANDILDEWDTVKPPPKPELKPVTLDGSTTALLLLDIGKGCGNGRPRCLSTIPALKRLNEAARAAGAMVWYSIPGQTVATNADGTLAGVVDQGFQPRAGEWEHERGPDKFLGSHLEEKLKARGIKTVVVCGNSFNGPGLVTSAVAAQRGYKVIVPIDCSASDEAYDEQYAAWHLFKGAETNTITQTTMTRSAMVKFQ